MPGTRGKPRRVLGFVSQGIGVSSFGRLRYGVAFTGGLLLFGGEEGGELFVEGEEEGDAVGFAADAVLQENGELANARRLKAGTVLGLGREDFFHV